MYEDETYDDMLWMELILSSPFDAYTLGRIFRSYNPETLKYSPANYDNPNAKFAIIAAGDSHITFYQRFMHLIGFTDIKTSGIAVARNPIIQFEDPFE